MQYKPTATVEAPSLGNEGATEGFRVGDLKVEARGFLQGLTSLLSVLPPAPAPQGLDLLTSDIKVQSLQEAIQTALGASDFESSELENPPESPPRRRRAARSAAEQPQPPTRHQNTAAATQAAPPREPPPSEAALESNPLDTGGKRQLEKLQTIEAYNAAVAGIRMKHEAGHAVASQRLRALQIEPQDAVKLGNRSFHDMIHQTQVAEPENALEEVDEMSEGDQSTLPAPTLTAATGAQVPAEEVVVRVAVHLPQAPAHVSEEWLLVGSQRLTELRDALFCLAETNLKNVEREENARRSVTGAPLLKLSNPSAYIYIEGTFYVDRRHPEAVDLSEGIRADLRKNNISAPLHPLPGPAARPLGSFTTDFTVASMHDTLFEDIWVRLGNGAAGVYCHQGGCEHLVVIQDVRAYDPAIDPQYISQYPFRVRNQGATLSRKRDCEACGLRGANKVTEGDRLVPHTPFFWCEECFRQMHYDEEGRALYTDYKVFPYQIDYLPPVLHEKRAGRAKWRGTGGRNANAGAGA